MSPASPTTTEAPPTRRLLTLAMERHYQAAAKAARVVADHEARVAQAQAKLDAEQAAKDQEAARKRAREEAEQRQVTEAERAAQEAAAEVARLEHLALLEDAEEAAASLYDQADLARNTRPAPGDLPAEAELVARQILGITIPADLWKVAPYAQGKAAFTHFLGGSWVFTHHPGEETYLYLHQVQPAEDNADVVPKRIASLAELGDLLARFPLSLAPPPEPAPPLTADEADEADEAPEPDEADKEGDK